MTDASVMLVTSRLQGLPSISIPFLETGGVCNIEPLDPIPGMSAVVLCIDDEPRGLHIRKKLLERYGYSVLTATSGRDALEVFADNPVTAVVLDYDMPGMDGCQVAAELKRLKPEVKILLLSAYVELPDAALGSVDRRAVKGTSATAFLEELQQMLTS